ncbi:hypothetical protein CsSME_00052327 [Camellia sinensis var. sinensis]
MAQPLRLEIKRKLAQRSERVKSVDLHPTEPWILASLYSGTVCIWNYQSQGNFSGLAKWVILIAYKCFLSLVESFPHGFLSWRRWTQSSLSVPMENPFVAALVFDAKSEPRRQGHLTPKREARASSKRGDQK